jgi:hypothetical protein
MEDKKQENNFKFRLLLIEENIAEKIFSADLYNPVVRYSVNIREMIPRIIGSIQKVLQTKSKDLTFVDENNYNTLLFYKKMCEINNLDYFKLRVPVQYPKSNVSPDTKHYQKRGGTEFKFGLYINSNTIVERNFYVDNYNPESRFSSELVDVINVIVENIEKHLKNSDLNHMWDDYKIINNYGLNIQQVRELSKEKRDEFLRRMGDYNFIERIRVDYNKQLEFTV